MSVLRLSMFDNKRFKWRFDRQTSGSGFKLRGRDGGCVTEQLEFLKNVSFNKTILKKLDINDTHETVLQKFKEGLIKSGFLTFFIRRSISFHGIT